MTFAPTFRRTFSPTFDRRNTAGAWWNLFGAIPNANCIAAYDSKNAASYAASKVNLVNSGTFGLSDGAAYPAWGAGTGWTFTSASSQKLLTSAWFTAAPFTVMFIGSCSAANNVAWSTGVLAGATTNLWDGRLATVATTYRGQFTIFASIGNIAVPTTNTYTLNSKVAITCIETSATSHRAVLSSDWANSGTSTTSRIPSGVDTSVVGAQVYNSAYYLYWNGVISQLAVWNIALTQSQEAAIATAALAL